MKKFYKIAGIVAGSLLIIGIIMCGIGYATNDHSTIRLFGFANFRFMGQQEAYECEYTVLEDFDSIDLTASMSDVNIVRGEEFAIEYRTYSDDTSAKVVNGTLIFKESSKKSFSFNFDFSFIHTYDSYVTIYVPEDLDVLTVDSAMGSVIVSDITADTMSLDLDMGDATITNCTSDEFTGICDMGSLEYDGTINSSANISISMGDASLTGYLACDITADCDMGSINFTSFYNDKSYHIYTDVDMGDTSYNYFGGKAADKTYTINASCSMGDIEFTFKDK